jgi:hypothetical protein
VIKRTCIPLIITLVVYSSLAHGYPFINFDPNKTKLTSSSFSRYVRPQVNSIINDFFHMIAKLGNGERRLIKLRRTITRELKKYNRWPDKCAYRPTLSLEVGPDIKKCQKQIAKLYHTLSSLEQSVLELSHESLISPPAPKEKKKSKKRGRNKKNATDQPMIHHLDSDRMIKVYSDLNQLALKLYATLHLLEERLITYHTPYDTNHKFNDRVKSNLKEMILISERVMLGWIKSEQRRELRIIWYGMIKKFEQRVLSKGGRRYLINNLESFNLIWNSFCMKQTKWDKPEAAVVTLIKTIHLRWNSILKVILR